MSTTRFFSGSRGTGNRMGEAARLKQMEILKGGKLAMTPTDRYKYIMRKKLEEYHTKTRNQRSTGVEMSKRARQALEEIAKRKAMKEEKAMRQMVVIKPRRYGSEGYIDKKGHVYDEMNNLVMKVNRKNGKIGTMSGMTIGRYKPKKMGHVTFMRDNIVKYSPYHARLRQLQLQQQAQNIYGAQGLTPPSSIYGPMGEESGINIYGRAGTLYSSAQDDGGSLYSSMGDTTARNNITVSAWGVTSNNIHGTFAEDVWGNFRDNVWGTNSSNIWGGIGDAGGLWGNGSAWGKPGRKIWGSGRSGQKNYIAMAFWGAAGLLGIGSKLAARQNARFRARMASGGRTSGRSAAPTGRTAK